MSADAVGPGARSSFASGANGAVAAGHPLAAAAALEVLRGGGNAVDAAIAGSAVQCVAELPWCGVAGDAFAMVRSAGGDVLAYNGSGAAPLDIGVAMGDRAQVPRHGPLSVGVPGLVDTWAAMSERCGSRPLGALLEPAIRLADGGVPIDGRLRRAFETLRSPGGDPELAAAIDAGGLDDVLRLPELASTLHTIATEGRQGFYDGPVAERLAAAVASLGGALSRADLEAHRGVWAAPVSVRFRDAVVHTQPVVSMGVLLLCAFRLLERWSPGRVTDDLVERTDALVRIKHLVFRQGLAELGDPEFVADRTDVLLSDGWIDAQLGRAMPAAVAGGGADTTSIAVTDRAGTTVSFIHSLFNEFGSRVIVPGTGLVLNDRLANLRTDPSLPNSLVGGKRPMHTLHSYIAERPDGTVFAGATPGGRGQVQTNLQVLLGVLEDGLDPVAAMDRTRWVNGLPRRAPDDDTLYLEHDFDAAAAAELGRRGHRIEFSEPDADDHFGACTIVSASPGTRLAVGDRRRSCAASAF